MIQSFAGFFPEADIFQSLNSPLWYFTLILFYYLVFPLLFEKRHPLVSAGLILLASYFVLSLNLPVNWDVLRMYQRHLWSFPLGIFFAGLMLKKSFWQRFFPTPTEKFLQNLTRLKTFSRWVLIAFFCFVAGYFAINSGIGESLNKEQTVSIIAMAAIVGIFLLKRFQFRLFYWFGLFSYEIYLLHWPIVYRYDLIYKFLPAGIATIIYLALFLFLGWGLRKVDDYLVKKIV
jgi:peptidoglycan/LPS O-acetylase OafA/YrhL